MGLMTELESRAILEAGTLDPTATHLNPGFLNPNHTVRCAEHVKVRAFQEIEPQAANEGFLRLKLALVLNSNSLASSCPYLTEGKCPGMAKDREEGTAVFEITGMAARYFLKTP
mmetsp:Transcript_8730/g.13857  ORF Transcript_8730/g.13857 Transcript_8730/m.13857 type:complete len:114 (-) Transcript_8730:950-1291(-)|eukprot:CAMPEP_0184328916 /NCGR_PEP_ID=MMETSP1049-20130417/143873_1 /TAXON_ID=77928 /ORGANISM="Proteomonas sulcata, Strain CCMP704" /LENGTH=113 /DNA_ID=CAMNT_0026651251 /DNA_START=2490 /DNA_END=2831 /DNA_ORIENTATION=+